MEIRKYLALFIAMHVTLICYSQTRIQSRDVKRIAGKAYLLSNGDQFEIRENVILAKLKAGKKHIKDGIKVIKSHSFGMLEIAVPDGVAVEEYRSTLEKTGEFESVEFDTYSKQCMSPNDSCYVNNQQWGLGHIDVDKAWEITTGSPSVKIAVIEGEGFEMNHPDLSLSVSEGVDYVNSPDPIIEKHGTMVAGIIGAKTNNTIGIAGIAGGNNSEGSTIIPYRALYASQDIAAIYDAVGKGVKIINMSFSNTQNSQF